ncbi:alpha/beta hydrolase family protein [Dactylosporangium sp. NPDC051541]|uniref:alpha/beta hydrolase family protein n=1 Tax=Dactylosporangium sp. NPDC051541 TaxID=3363977 RepID=UPI0037B85E8C
MPTPVITVHPITLPAPGRGTDFTVRVSAPTTGDDRPVIVLSHGFGQSAIGYEPLAGYWAAHGLVVVQPTHLDSRTLGLAPDDPRTPDIWRIRIADLKLAIDHLDTLAAAVPGLTGRVDTGSIAVAGHSWGAQTASTLLGARTPDGEDFSDPRVSRGVLLAITGTGGADLSPFAAEHFPFMSPDFGDMKAPALIVAGDNDRSQLSVRGPDWFTDAYHRSPGPKSLLTLFGAEHSLGGVAGYESAETTDEHPGRVALIQRLTTAYLHGSADLAADADLGTLEERHG